MFVDQFHSTLYQTQKEEIKLQPQILNEDVCQSPREVHYLLNDQSSEGRKGFRFGLFSLGGFSAEMFLSVSVQPNYNQNSSITVDHSHDVECSSYLSSFSRRSLFFFSLLNSFHCRRQDIFLPPWKWLKCIMEIFCVSSLSTSRNKDWQNWK